MNTKIDYLYRDADNYKKPMSVIAAGRITKEERSTIMKSLDGGIWFIPRRVGLPEERFEELDLQSDHAFFEMGEISETAAPATISVDISSLAKRFATITAWDDYNSFIEDALTDHLAESRKEEADRHVSTQVVFFSQDTKEFHVGIAFSTFVICAATGKVYDRSKVDIQRALPWNDLERGITQGRVADILSAAVRGFKE